MHEPMGHPVCCIEIALFRGGDEEAGLSHTPGVVDDLFDAWMRPAPRVVVGNSNWYDCQPFSVVHVISFPFNLLKFKILSNDWCTHLILMFILQPSCALRQPETLRHVWRIRACCHHCCCYETSECLGSFSTDHQRHLNTKPFSLYKVVYRREKSQSEQ